MPTYQYACTACAHELEAVQSFSDDPLTTCPVCEGQLRKRFGSVGIVFKGSGFYRTDSRAAANGNGSSGDKGSASGQGTETKGGETKNAENKGTESKSGDSKSSGESKSAGTEKKPAAASAPSS